MHGFYARTTFYEPFLRLCFDYALQSKAKQAMGLPLKHDSIYNVCPSSKLCHYVKTKQCHLLLAKQSIVIFTMQVETFLWHNYEKYFFGVVVTCTKNIIVKNVSELNVD